jgi:hypothetical protein
MYKYRTRYARIVLGDPLPKETPLPKPVPKNIVAEALKVKAFLAEDPTRVFLHASQHFKVSKALISHLMKIADALPLEFVDYMGRCEDQKLIRWFSGKALLRIAGIESPIRREQVIGQLMEKTVVIEACSCDHGHV